MNTFIQNRITDAEALDMLQNMPTAELMARADGIRRERHGNKTYYVHSHNLNPTNLCVVECGLCSFWRPEGAPDAYITTLEEARENLERAQNCAIKPSAAGNRKRIRVMHIGTAGNHRYQLLASTDQVLIGFTFGRRRAHPNQAIFTVKHHIAAARNEGCDHRRHADAQIDQPAIFHVLGGAGGDLLPRQKVCLFAHTLRSLPISYQPVT